MNFAFIRGWFDIGENSATVVTTDENQIKEILDCDSVSRPSLPGPMVAIVQ